MLFRRNYDMCVHIAVGALYKCMMSDDGDEGEDDKTKILNSKLTNISLELQLF